MPWMVRPSPCAALPACESRFLIREHQQELPVCELERWRLRCNDGRHCWERDLSRLLSARSKRAGDGGAEEAQYGFRCIDNLLRAPDGTPLSPDVVMFNWGLHNSLSGNKTSGYVPGQSGSPKEYAPYLRKIVAFLQAAPALAQEPVKLDRCFVDKRKTVIN